MVIKEEIKNLEGVEEMQGFQGKRRGGMMQTQYSYIKFREK